MSIKAIQTEYLSAMDGLSTEKAYRMARQARFEYGETPKRRN